MKFKIVLFILCFSYVTLYARPPTVPPAGVVERDLEKQYEAQPLEMEKNVPNIKVDIPKETLKLPEGKKIYICDIKIEGNSVIPTKILKSLIDLKGGCKVSISDIYKICQKIETFYAKKGYFLARAYPPPQEIKNNTLIIRVLEGKLGNIKIIGNKYYKSKFILRYFSKMQHKAIRYDKFLRVMMLLNDIPDLSAGSIFVKGKKVGEADVILKVKDKNPIHLYLNGNNYGRYLTTDSRIGARLDKGSLFMYNDKFSIAEVVGFPIKALYFTDIIYSVPLNTNGHFLEGAYLTSRFHVHELSDLRLKGESDIATLKYIFSLRRSRYLSSDLFAYFDYKQIKNFTLSHRTSFDKLRVLTFGASLDHNSPCFGRDYLVMRFGFGIPGFLGGLDHNSSHTSRPGAHGNFFIFNLDYDRIQKLPRDAYFYFHASGQLSPSKLTVPEQIYIGGADTVRGFPLAVALGDSGYYTNIEFRLPPYGIKDCRFFLSRKKWKQVLEFAAFLDHGGTFLKATTDTFLWGSGLGVILNGPGTLSFTAEMAFPLNHRDRSKDPFYYLKITARPF